MRGQLSLKVCLLVSLLLPVVWQAVAVAEKVKSDPHKWAILIGVDDYIDATDLKYCGADQLALQKHLIASGFPQEQVFLLHTKAEEQKYLPFKRNIEKQLKLILSLVEEDDIVVLAFSGHGVHFDESSYLCPTDAELADPETLISIPSLYTRLKKCNASMKLMLVDACRNDPRPGGQRTLTEGTKEFARSLKDQRPPEGVVLLNSCAPGEISWEDDDFGHGVFMHYLLEGLEGKADVNKNSQVSLGELSDYASRKTGLYVARKYNDSQRPFMRVEGDIQSLEFGIVETEDPDYELALKLYLGDGMLLDYPRAYQLFRKAADRGHTLAKTFVGLFLVLDSYGIQKDLNQATDWFNSAMPTLRSLAEEGEPVAESQYAVMFDYGLGVKKDSKEALKWYMRSASKNYAHAQRCVGMMYQRELGVQLNDTEAVKWLRMASEQQYAPAFSDLGYMYGTGKGVTRDLAAGGKAAELGDPNAQHQLGWKYNHGIGVQVDHVEAMKWYRMAVQQDIPVSMCNIGLMYEEGEGVRQDYSEALKWYRKAANYSDSTAQHNIGMMYKNGRGVARNYSEAANWFRKAINGSDVAGTNSARAALRRMGYSY